MTTPEPNRRRWFHFSLLPPKVDEWEEVEQRLGDLWSMSERESAVFGLIVIAATVILCGTGCFLFWWLG